MSLASLAEAMRKELTTLGIPSVLEMALVSTSGKVVYSDLGKPALNKVSPFYDSLLLMNLGDNLSLAMDTTKSIIASRVSNKAILIVLTDKKIGIVLTKMGTVADKFGRLLDELIAMEASRPRESPVPSEIRPEPTPVPQEAPPVVEEIEPPVPPPIAPEPARVPEPETRTVAAPPIATTPRKTGARAMVPFLTDVRILEKCPEKDRRFLELFDGILSLNDIAKRLGVPFFDALQVANKYKNQGKVVVKEVIRG